VGLCCFLLCCVILRYSYIYVMFLYHNFKVKHKLYIASGTTLPISKISVARPQSQFACKFSKNSNIERHAHKLYLLCNFGSNRWGIKNTIREEQIKFRVHLGIFVKTHFPNTRSIATNDEKVLSTDR